MSISEVGREKLGSGGEHQRIIMDGTGLIAKNLLGSGENSWRDMKRGRKMQGG
jgi:hypothetical protein